MGISIGLKNCLDIVDTVGKYYDFCVNERCAQKGECHWYKNYLKTGKPVFSISYGGMSESRRKTTCKNINGLPIYVVVKPGEKLDQRTIPFDPHKDCGSSYHAEKVSPPVVEEPKKITPAKTATIKKTTTVKKTNPVNVPKSVNMPVTPSNSKSVTPGNSKVVTPSNKVVTPGNSMVVTPSNKVVTPGNSMVVTPSNKVVTPGNSMVVTPSNKVVTPGAPVKQTEKSVR